MFSLYQVNDKHNLLSKIPQQEYMKNLTVTHYTDSGEIKDQLQAVYWAYMPEKQSSFLSEPNLHLFKPNGAEWIVKSQTGIAHHITLNSKISKLELNTDVFIERLANKNFTPVIMKTESLLYFPDEETIETDKFVSMEKPGLAISGMGLKSNLQKSLVTILDNVKTRYVNES